MTKKISTVDVRPDALNGVYVPHFENMARTQIFFGGSSSGKSVFLAQRAVIDVMNNAANKGRNYLICRAVGRTVRRSVFNEIQGVITAFGVGKFFDINKSESIITCKNGYQILFTGLDDTEKLKSITPAKGVITDIWIEEATETEREAVKQLLKRQRGGDPGTPKRLTLSFNPIMQTHWIYEEYFSTVAWADDQTEYISDDLTILKTTYKDNHFLTEQDKKDLENEKDSYFYNVYTLGNWGILGDVIFTNWRVEDLSGMIDQFTNHRNGLDFGFASDPAAMPVTHYDRMRQTIYIYKELYERELTNDLLAKEIKDLIGSGYVTCDSAEPKSVAELRSHGVNAISARKGKDSVNFGIQWLKQQTVIVDKTCVKTKTELQQYQWKKDKDGNSMKVPVDKNNHIIDGLRYAYEDDMERLDPSKMIDAV
jgi:phage terminase large subunit